MESNERDPLMSERSNHHEDSGNAWSQFTISDASLKRDIYRYRLKFLFSQSCGSFCKSVRRRFPTGVGVYTILLMLGLEQMAFSAAEGLIIGTRFHDLTPLVTSAGLNLVVKLLFPIMGWLADVWVGRYRMIHLSMWLLFCGYGTAAFFSSLHYYVASDWNEPYTLLLCYVVINIGSAGFQANAIPFGADQINYKTSHELSSYFYMYYWVRNAGSLMVCFLITCEGKFDGYFRSSVYSMIAVLTTTVILLLNTFLRHRFLIRNKRSNPLKTVVKVLYTSLVSKRPRYRSAFSYNPSSILPSRMDLTKETHGGKFKEETVEDVKTFLRLLLILFALGTVLCTYAGVSCMMELFA